MKVNVLKFLVIGLVLANAALAQTAPAADSSPALQGNLNVSHPTSTRLSVAPALGVLGGELGAGADIGVLFPTNSPVSFGLQTGFYRWADSARAGTITASASVLSVPILATAIYRMDASPTIHPYVGLSLGVSVTHGRLSANAYGYGEASASATKLFFEGLVRPGVEIDLTPSIAFYAEPKFGLLRDSFVFLPHAGLMFSI